ncbi:MAG: hypothetical protein K2X49_01435, partial [Acetobacteraceae bacterium]|nr:hypothetical protein [Acetobacteraceae bacterium]
MTAAMLEDPPALAEAAVPLAPPPVAVALRLADPDLAARLAALPGQVPLPQMAAVLVTDGLPEPGDPARVLVLAEDDAAARRALGAGALAVL